MLRAHPWLRPSPPGILPLFTNEGVTYVCHQRIGSHADPSALLSMVSLGNQRPGIAVGLNGVKKESPIGLKCKL
jgi:hypothetical protein